MGKFLAIVGGLVAMVGAVILVLPKVWGPYFKAVIFGMIPLVLFFGGLIALIAGISSIKDAARTKKLEEETKETKA
jgi:uncharacterized protein (DUF2062 family)